MNVGVLNTGGVIIVATAEERIRRVLELLGEEAG
jgi:hypothetical protein